MVAEGSVTKELLPCEIIKREMEEKYPCLRDKRGKHTRTPKMRQNTSVQMRSYLEKNPMPEMPEEDRIKRSVKLKGRAPWNKGKHLTAEDKWNKSIAQKDKKHTAEHTQKVREAQTGKIITAEQRKNMSIAHLGKTLPESQKRKIGAKTEAMWAVPGKKEEISNAVRASLNTEEMHTTLSDIQKKLNQNPEYKAKRIEATKAGYTPKVREGMSASQTERYANEENRKETSEAMKRLWQHLTPEERSRKIKKMRTGSGIVKPTIPEQKVLALLDCCCPNTFIYTGDGSFVMGGFIPDFVDCNGSKKVIEVFGEYWHSFEKIGRTRGEEEKVRKEKFAEFGFSCLIIWEDEFNDEVGIENTANKLIAFSQRRKEG